METKNVHEFLKYFERVHERTARLLSLIPENRLEFSLSEKQFSFGDIIRHLANIERFMFVETALGKPNRYTGHGKEFANGYQAVMNYYATLHDESIQLLNTLTDDALEDKCTTPTGTKITTWKWLRAMLEHEIHHRGQMYLMLGMLGIATPPIFGLTSEEVLNNSKD